MLIRICSLGALLGRNVGHVVMFVVIRDADLKTNRSS